MTTTRPTRTTQLPRTAGSRTAAITAPAIVLVAVLLISLTMRAPILAVAPVIADVKAGLGIGSATAGLFTTIPVICFGLGSPLVLAVSRRWSIDRAVLIGLFVTLAGIALRSAGGLPAVLAGTIVLGLGITVGNVLIPVIIGRDFAGRTAQVTGFYTAALNIGALAATVIGAHLAGGVGWRWSLAMWGAFVLLAVAVWRRAMPFTRGRITAPPIGASPTGAPPTGTHGTGTTSATVGGTASVAMSGTVDGSTPAMTGEPTRETTGELVGEAARELAGESGGRRTPALPATPGSPAAVVTPVDGTAGGPPPLWRRKLVIGMVLAFAGQSFSYYSIAAWLPNLLADERGLSASAAGASSSIFQLVSLVAAFGLPVVMARGLSTRAAMLLVCGTWFCLPLGLAVAPTAWVFWCCLGGFAQGGAFTVIFSVIVARAVDSNDARRMSATVQGVGYTLGALGPLMVGVVHTATGGWTTPMLVVAAMIVVMTVGGTTAIGSPRTPITPGAS